MSAMLVTLLLESLRQTAVMVGVAAILGSLFGLPLGILLVVTTKGHILERPTLNKALGVVVNITRSTPFIILMVAIIPFTRLVAGTSVGTYAAIVPLTVAITPFIARLSEAAMREVDAGLIEAALSVGATPLQIIRKVIVPEAMPGIVAALTISLIGYSAMAGTVGGGGLGDLGIRFGYQRFMPEVMLVVVVILVGLVQGIQTLGDLLARKVNKRLKARA